VCTAAFARTAGKEIQRYALFKLLFDGCVRGLLLPQDMAAMQKLVVAGELCLPLPLFAHVVSALKLSSLLCEELHRRDAVGELFISSLLQGFEGDVIDSSLFVPVFCALCSHTSPAPRLDCLFSLLTRKATGIQAREHQLKILSHLITFATSCVRGLAPAPEGAVKSVDQTSWPTEQQAAAHKATRTRQEPIDVRDVPLSFHHACAFVEKHAGLPPVPALSHLERAAPLPHAHIATVLDTALGLLCKHWHALAGYSSKQQSFAAWSPLHRVLKTLAQALQAQHAGGLSSHPLARLLSTFLTTRPTQRVHTIPPTSLIDEIVALEWQVRAKKKNGFLFLR
jgi:hypothetical protein